MNVRPTIGSGVKRRLAGSEVDDGDLGHAQKKPRVAYRKPERPGVRPVSPFLAMSRSRQTLRRAERDQRWSRDQTHLLRKFALQNWSRVRRASISPEHHEGPFALVISSDEDEDADGGCADRVCSTEPRAPAVREPTPPSLGPSNYQAIDDEDDPFDADEDLWPSCEVQSGHCEADPEPPGKERSDGGSFMRTQKASKSPVPIKASQPVRDSVWLKQFAIKLALLRRSRG